MSGPPHAGRGHDGALQVGVAGQRHAGLGAGALQGDVRGLDAQRLRARQLFLQPQARGDQHLVVAAAAGVDAAPRVPEALDQARLDRGMAVLERSEEHTSELQSLMRISYAVFCLKKKTTALTPA